MQGQRSNQGHTMTLHTYTPPTNVPTKYQFHTPYGFRDIAQTRFYRSRSLQQGQIKGQTLTLHTYNLQPISLPSNNFLHLMVSEI